MKIRLVLVSVALLATSCSQSSDDGAGGVTTLVDDATITTVTTSGTSDGAEAVELPIVDEASENTTVQGEESTAQQSEDNSADESVNGETSIPPDSTVEATDEGSGVSSETEFIEETVAVASDAMTACALVEAGFIASLDGDTGSIDLYRRGAEAAIASSAYGYVELGETLLNQLPGQASAEADALLNQCASDGFERLAE